MGLTCNGETPRDRTGVEPMTTCDTAGAEHDRLERIRALYTALRACWLRRTGYSGPGGGCRRRTW